MRATLLLAAVAVPLGLVLVPATGVAWEAGDDHPHDPPAWWVGVTLAQWWLGATGWDLQLVYQVTGALHALATAGVAVTVHAVAGPLGLQGTVRHRVALWGLAVGSVAMAGAYTVGFGFLTDLFAFLVAVGATISCGVLLLRRGDRRAGWTLTAGMAAAFGFALYWCIGYVPGFVALALALAWAPVGLRAARPPHDAQATGPLDGTDGPTAPVTGTAPGRRAP